MDDQRDTNRQDDQPSSGGSQAASKGINPVQHSERGAAPAQTASKGINPVQHSERGINPVQHSEGRQADDPGRGQERGGVREDNEKGNG